MLFYLQRYPQTSEKYQACLNIFYSECSIYSSEAQRYPQTSEKYQACLNIFHSECSISSSLPQRYKQTSEKYQTCLIIFHCAQKYPQGKPQVHDNMAREKFPLFVFLHYIRGRKINEMKAMIFAAGLGTRLKPLTDTLPKALVPVCGKPLIEHVARKLFSAGIDEAVVNIHYFADKVEQWVGQQQWVVTEKCEKHDGKMLVEISDERELLLETGGAVLHARRYLEGCGRFLIHNVDILSNCDINWFEQQVKDDALASLLVSDRKTTRFLLFEPESMRMVG